MLCGEDVQAISYLLHHRSLLELDSFCSHLVDSIPKQMGNMKVHPAIILELQSIQQPLDVNQTAAHNTPHTQGVTSRKHPQRMTTMADQHTTELPPQQEHSRQPQPTTPPPPQKKNP
jgi:septum formation inhibitor MinC